MWKPPQKVYFLVGVQWGFMDKILAKRFQSNGFFEHVFILLSCVCFTGKVSYIPTEVNRHDFQGNSYVYSCNGHFSTVAWSSQSVFILVLIPLQIHLPRAFKNLALAPTSREYQSHYHWTLGSTWPAVSGKGLVSLEILSVFMVGGDRSSEKPRGRCLPGLLPPDELESLRSWSLSSETDFPVPWKRNWS